MDRTPGTKAEARAAVEAEAMRREHQREETVDPHQLTAVIFAKHVASVPGSRSRLTVAYAASVELRSVQPGEPLARLLSGGGGWAGFEARVCMRCGGHLSGAEEALARTYAELTDLAAGGLFGLLQWLDQSEPSASQAGRLQAWIQHVFRRSKEPMLPFLDALDRFLSYPPSVAPFSSDGSPLESVSLSLPTYGVSWPSNGYRPAHKPVLEQLASVVECCASLDGEDSERLSSPLLSAARLCVGEATDPALRYVLACDRSARRRFDEAEADLRAAVDARLPTRVGAMAPSALHYPLAALQRSHLLAAAGRMEAAWEALAEALQAAQSIPDESTLLLCQVHMTALLEWMLGHSKSAASGVPDAALWNMLRRTVTSCLARCEAAGSTDLTPVLHMRWAYVLETMAPHYLPEKDAFRWVLASLRSAVEAADRRLEPGPVRRAAWALAQAYERFGYTALASVWLHQAAQDGPLDAEAARAALRARRTLQTRHETVWLGASFLPSPDWEVVHPLCRGRVDPSAPHDSPIHVSVRDPALRVEELGLLARKAVREGQREAARRHAELAYPLAKALGRGREEAQAALCLAHVECADGRWQEARRWADQARRLAEGLRLPWLMVDAWMALAETWRGAGAEETARPWLRNALELARAWAYRPRMAEAALRLAELDGAALPVLPSVLSEVVRRYPSLLARARIGGLRSASHARDRLWIHAIPDRAVAYALALAWTEAADAAARMDLHLAWLQFLLSYPPFLELLP